MMFHVGDDDGPDDLRDELAVLLAFLSRRPLTTTVRDLEVAQTGPLRVGHFLAVTDV